MKGIHLVLLIVIVLCSGKPRATDTKSGASVPSGKEVVCFIYHRFADSRYPSTNISLHDFEQHLSYLTKNNYQVLSFSAALDYLESDEPVRKTAVITIDDGYTSFYKNGFPLLKKYNFPATLFINTKTVGGGDYMNWAELKAVTSNHIEIGNHTHSHDFFLNESASSRYETFKDEIELSQSLISKHLNIIPEVFSYPYGEFDPEMKSIVKNAGFRAAAAQNSGVIGNETDLFECPRFPMSEAYSTLDKFAEKASAHALKIVRRSPGDYILPENKKPLLTLTIDNTDLRIQQLQCFVQGGECQLRVLEKKEKEITVTVQAKKPISGRRRTLYTVTVPDSKGKWYWYSHLWINSKVD
jgi:peptidoglycan/xylan/chitin deacetylase (PgdA/CDA1 family)